MQTKDYKRVLLLRPEEIFPSSDRQRKDIDEYALRALARSIKAQGIIEPLIVRKDGKSRYVLVSGERRLKAAKMIGMRRLPCVIHNTDQKYSAIAALAENLQRVNLSCFEAAQAIEEIMAVYGVTLSFLAESLGLTKAILQSKLKLLKIGALERERMLAAGLNEDHARALLRLNTNDIPLVLDTVIEKNLSAKQTEQFVSAILSPVIESNITPISKKAAIGNEKFFSNSLSRLLLTLQNAGVQVSSVKRETEDYIEYEVRIEKNTVHQLRLTGV